jgi:hypothetical protein
MQPISLAMLRDIVCSGKKVKPDETTLNLLMLVEVVVEQSTSKVAKRNIPLSRSNKDSYVKKESYSDMHRSIKKKEETDDYKSVGLSSKGSAKIKSEGHEEGRKENGRVGAPVKLEENRGEEGLRENLGPPLVTRSAARKRSLTTISEPEGKKGKK